MSSNHRYCRTCLAIPFHGGLKLPKLNAPPFNGSPIKWDEFWDVFDSFVHSNPNLSDVQKFTYLRGMLTGSASAAIAGISITNRNYREAVEGPQKWFGKPEVVKESSVYPIAEPSCTWSESVWTSICNRCYRTHTSPAWEYWREHRPPIACSDFARKIFGGCHQGARSQYRNRPFGTR